MLTALGAGLWLWFLSMRAADPGVDVHAYYVGEYGSLGGRDAYLYSPAFSQVIEPLRWLGWEVFRDTWRVLEVGVLVALAGPISGALVFANPVALEVLAGNIQLLIAGVIVAGFRYPALWAFVLLTKVTPGVGLLWFVVRREWRKAAIALGATAAVIVVSFALDPSAWLRWLAVPLHPGESDAVLIPAPLWLRLPLAGALIAWAAPRDARWAMPFAVVLAMPAVWLTSISTLVACIYLAGSPALSRLLRPARRQLVPVGPGLPSVPIESQRLPVQSADPTVVTVGREPTLAAIIATGNESSSRVGDRTPD